MGSEATQRNRPGQHRSDRPLIQQQKNYIIKGTLPSSFSRPLSSSSSSFSFIVLNLQICISKFVTVNETIRALRSHIYCNIKNASADAIKMFADNFISAIIHFRSFYSRNSNATGDRATRLHDDSSSRQTHCHCPTNNKVHSQAHRREKTPRRTPHIQMISLSFYRISTNE